MEGWVEREIEGCEFSDERLKTRFGKLLGQLGKRIGAALNPIDLTNTIRPNGTVPVLNLSAGRQLVVRNYHGDSSNYFGDDPLPIRVLQQFHASAGGTLEVLFDADDWGSTITFAPSIPVTREGTLELAFADGIDLTSQIGRTFDVFDWTGVMPSGVFNITSPYVWDTSRLYITGEVTFLAAAGLPGDFNEDGTVNSSDFVVWRKGLGSIYTQAAYDVWRSHFGQTAGQGATLPSIPEPTSTLLLLPFAAIAIWRHRLHPTDRSSGSETHSN